MRVPALSVPWAIVVAAVIIGPLWILFPRTATIQTQYGYIERDRWTGRIRTCNVDNPFTYISREIAAGKTPLPFVSGDAPGMYRYVDVESHDPPRICLDLN